MPTDPGKPYSRNPPAKPAKQSGGGSFDDLINKLAHSGGGAPPSKKTQNADQIAVGMFKKSGPKWISTGYYQSVLDAAHLYGVPAPYLAALFLQENPAADKDRPNGQGSDALGLAQILDSHLYNYNKSRKLVWGQGNTLATGDVITPEMKKNPAFAIAYAAWRLAGGLTTYGNFKDAYQKGYHGANPDGSPVPDPTRFIGDYVPSKSDYQPSPLNKKIANQPTGQSSDPYVTVDKKGNLSTTIDSTSKSILEYEGFPITVGDLQRQVQDKNGIGGLVYSLTGLAPNAKIVANLMNRKVNGQQMSVGEIENYLIASKYFPKSPTGKKYSASYQGVWDNIMGPDQGKVPTALVKKAAMSNLSQDEFATQIRHSPNYLNSNEYKQKLTVFQDSYSNIYGPQNEGTKKLISDAALSGWDQNQFEHYLRSQSAYTNTAEYKGHALDILNSLGLSFGFAPSLMPNTKGPLNPAVPDVAPDKKDKTPTPADQLASLGVNF